MRTKVYGEEPTAETLEKKVTGGILYLDLKPYLNDWVGTKWWLKENKFLMVIKKLP